MEPLTGPLEDPFNPPPRYLLESDSEDEIGGGEYGNIRPTLKSVQSGKPHTVVSTHTPSCPTSCLIVGVGSAGAQLFGSVTGNESSDSPITADIDIDGFTVGSWRSLNGIAIVSVPGALPNTTLNALSKWIMNSFKPVKLSVVDLYPTPSYIVPAATYSEHRRSHLVHPIRFLRTTPSGPNDLEVPTAVEPFAPPNLLSTQTLAASLLCVAQQYQLKPSSPLQSSTVLLLLPYPHIPHPPPRTLVVSKAILEPFNWPEDTLSTVHKSLGLEAFGISLEASASMANQGKPTKPAKRSLDDSMYI
ncbi:hypothetical protein FRB99_005978 [Tulasnella sp. 403]|nr:hypothetical protein FRB99_005978 [Tulasnella sp. 403]